MSTDYEQVAFEAGRVYERLMLRDPQYNADGRCSPQPCLYVLHRARENRSAQRPVCVVKQA